jgi:hypothetical protein
VLVVLPPLSIDLPSLDTLMKVLFEMMDEITQEGA